MSVKGRGDFSRSLFSLQLQVQTLLEEAGGDEALHVLDALCKLNKSEQKIALKIFKRVLDRVADGQERLCTMQDKALNDFEENLYKDILSTMRGASAVPKERKFEVLEGGKIKKVESKTIDFAAAREAKKAGWKPVLN
ncbi:hypothetical protein OAO01_05555 [Oligoflexia bacterium]|nr:hypothetical protein [Oligoflexia bacterium]